MMRGFHGDEKARVIKDDESDGGDGLHLWMVPPETRLSSQLMPPLSQRGESG